MIFIVALVLLIPLSLIESMKQVSYISITAMISISCALIYIVVEDIEEIRHPTFDKTYEWFNFSGLPYFFGIAMFIFEGNALSLEIYHQMENAQTKFITALGYALLITATFIITVGSLSYGAYG